MATPKKKPLSFMDRAKKCFEIKELERLGLSPTLEQRTMILTYIASLLKWNPAAGLVSPKDEDGLFLRHFCDSLQPLLLFGFKKDARIIDVGAGGGFPSIPIRLFRPDLTIVLGESNGKKASFLQEVVKELNFSNMEVFRGRVERYPEDKRNFDYVISRGVTSLQSFAELAKPLIAPDGHMYTFKTKKFSEELEGITKNKDADGIRIAEIAEYDLGNQIFGFNLISLELTSGGK